MDNSNTGRRPFIKSIAGLGMLGLAGCAGESDGGSNGTTTTTTDSSETTTTTTSEASGPTTVVHTAGSSDTTSSQMVQGIAVVVNEQTDEVEIQPRSNEGSRANPRDLAQDDTDIAHMSGWVSNLFAKGEEPYNQFEYTPNAIMHFLNVQWFWVTPHDWNTFADIPEGAAINPAPSGSSSRPSNEHAMNTILEANGKNSENYEYKGLDYGSHAGALSEGTLDVGQIAMVNGSIMAGWSQELINTVDVSILGYADATRDALASDSAILMSEASLSEYTDPLVSYPAETMSTPTDSYWAMARDDYPKEPLKEYLSTMWEHREKLGERHGLLNFYKQDEFWVQTAHENRPFHPAAAELYKEKGVWKDEFEVGGA